MFVRHGPSLNRLQESDLSIHIVVAKIGATHTRSSTTIFSLRKMMGSALHDCAMRFPRHSDDQ